MADAEDQPSVEEAVAELEELFKERYTEQDEEYIATFKTAFSEPPCVENWYSRPKRTFDWSRDGRGRGRGGHRDGYNDRDRSYNHDRSYDRHGGGRHRDHHGHHAHDRVHYAGVRRTDDPGRHGHHGNRYNPY